MNMVADGSSSSGALWRSIRREAETALANDPIFGRSLSASILDHSDLGAAVAYQIGQRLGKSASDRRQFARAANQAFAASPDLVEAARRDLAGIVLHDPASTAFLPALVNFKGYVALQAWRVSNWLWQRNRRDLALLLQSESSDSLQVTILQNVTIGRNVETPNRAPRIGRGVLLSTGATILGDISIGDFAKIGAGSVVTCDVPRGCTAVGVPARLTNCPDPVPS